MKIGIIGVGIVGGACKKGFEKCGFDVKVHDIKLKTDIVDVLDTEIVYICVPTPSNTDGSCNTDIVELVIARLLDLDYQGIIAIKSTIPPGTTDSFIKKYTDSIVFVPEFLKERSAEYDFIFDHRLLVIGTDNINHSYVVQRSHGKLPNDIIRVSPSEAEMMKYFHNAFNATRVVFANIFYEMCQKQDINYDKVKEAFLKQNYFPDEYLDVKPELRGYGGACLPKDVKAMQKFCDIHNLGFNFFNMIDTENNKFKKTVFKGMRN